MRNEANELDVTMRAAFEAFGKCRDANGARYSRTEVEDTMPRNVRNFWIEVDVDGRPTTIAAGPRAKDGGFTLRMYMRNNGEVERVLTVQGRAMGDGHLSLMTWDDSREGAEVTVVRRKR